MNVYRVRISVRIPEEDNAQYSWMTTIAESEGNASNQVSNHYLLNNGYEEMSMKVTTIELVSKFSLVADGDIRVVWLR